MADERYDIHLDFQAVESGAEEGEKPMVKMHVEWNRAHYTQLVLNEDAILTKVLGETVEWGKANPKFLATALKR